MAKYSMIKGGKQVGPAEVYAPPHTMEGKPVTIQNALRKSRDPNIVSAKGTTNKDVAMRVSTGDPGRDDVKRDGIKMRGTGAATKGKMSRGPMA
jgi:hypothetical protein